MDERITKLTKVCLGSAACLIYLVHGSSSVSADELVRAPAPGQQVKLRLQEYAFKTKRNVEIAWDHWQTPHPEHPLSTVVRVTVDSLGKSNITIIKSSTDVEDQSVLACLRKTTFAAPPSDVSEFEFYWTFINDGKENLLASTKSIEADAFNKRTLGATIESDGSLLYQSTNEPEKPPPADFARYMQYLRRALKKEWHPPESTDRNQVIVQFKLMNDGSVVDLRVTKSSEVPGFDGAALNAIRQASPLNDLPRGSNPKGEDVEFTFDYRPQPKREVENKYNEQDHTR